MASATKDARTALMGSVYSAGAGAPLIRANVALCAFLWASNAQLSYLRSQERPLQRQWLPTRLREKRLFRKILTSPWQWLATLFAIRLALIDD